MSFQSVILVGGLGTRLGELTRQMPKPMLPIVDVPFLDFIIKQCVNHGSRKILLLAGFCGDLVQETYAGSSKNRFPKLPKFEIDVVIEPESMGTAGALRYAENYLDVSFLLLNGDTFFDFNINDLTSRSVTDLGESVFARVATRTLSNTSRYGIVKMAGTRILSFAERPGEVGQAGSINAGIYWLSRSILEWIPLKGAVSLERDVFPKLAHASHLHGHNYDGNFIDIGIPSDYERAQEIMPKSFTRPALFLDRDGVINQDNGYFYKIEEFEWMDGSRELVKLAADLGYHIFIVTNQAGVARGFYSEASVMKLHEWICDEVNSIGSYITDFRYCPHHPQGTNPAYVKACPWRKPNAGMINDLLTHYDVEKEKSLMIGDKETDMGAAEAAGIAGYLFTGNNLFDFAAPLLQPRKCNI